MSEKEIVSVKLIKEEVVEVTFVDLFREAVGRWRLLTVIMLASVIVAAIFINSVDEVWKSEAVITYPSVDKISDFNLFSIALSGKDVYDDQSVSLFNKFTGILADINFKDYRYKTGHSRILVKEVHKSPNFFKVVSMADTKSDSLRNLEKVLLDANKQLFESEAKRMKSLVSIKLQTLKGIATSNLRPSANLEDSLSLLKAKSEYKILSGKKINFDNLKAFEFVVKPTASENRYFPNTLLISVLALLSGLLVFIISLIVSIYFFRIKNIKN